VVCLIFNGIERGLAYAFNVLIFCIYFAHVYDAIHIVSDF
jgi:hypothetical protein